MGVPTLGLCQDLDNARVQQKDCIVSMELLHTSDSDSIDKQRMKCSTIPATFLRKVNVVL